MTLNILVGTSRGVWMSSDYRLTDLATGNAYRQETAKSIESRFDRGFLSINYTGIGLYQGEHYIDRIRKVLKGVDLGFDGTVDRIARETQSWLAEELYRRQMHHTVTMAGSRFGEKLAIILTNMEPTLNGEDILPRRNFSVYLKPITEETGVLLITGCRTAVSENDIAIIRKLARLERCKPDDLMGLLSATNRRASQHRRFKNRISPDCVVNYFPFDMKGGQVASYSSIGIRTDPKLDSPFLIHGLDFSTYFREMLAQSRQYFSLPDDVSEAEKAVASEKMSEMMDRVSKRAVDPKV